MSKRRNTFADFIIAPADTSLVGGHYREGDGFARADIYVKLNSPDLPYRVANEYICAKLGQFLGLPIPSFELMKLPGDGWCFAILDFNTEKSSLLPVSPEACVRSNVLLCTGIVLFDVLIGNADRHDENLRTDDRLNPKRIVVYDHDAALLGPLAPGTDRLNQLEGMLGIAGETPTSNLHCLLPALDTQAHFEYWLIRIADIPDWFIRDICNTVVSRRLLSRDDANAAAAFLRQRKTTIGELLDRHKEVFSQINPWQNCARLFR